MGYVNNGLAQRKNVTKFIFRKAHQFDIFCRIDKLKRKTLIFQFILKDLHIQDTSKITQLKGKTKENRNNLIAQISCIFITES